MNSQLNIHLIKRLFKELLAFLKDSEPEITDVWLSLDEIETIQKYDKPHLRTILSDLESISIQKGNYINYVVINKILFIIECFQFIEVDINQLSVLLDFKGFEALIEEILKRNNFKTIKNFRFSDKSNFKSKTSQKRYEIDIIGIYSKYVVLIDAKQWRRKDSFSSINRAANLQYRRAIALKKNPQIFSELIQKLLSNKTNLKRRLPFIIIPMMVTLEDNSIRINNNQIPLVSIFELNSFLQELQNNLFYFKTIQVNRIYIQKSLS
ncbi:MAG: hypothetical protein ACFE9N_09295 [Promethearchaeota archaeon]